MLQIFHRVNVQTTNILKNGKFLQQFIITSWWSSCMYHLKYKTEWNIETLLFNAILFLLRQFTVMNFSHQNACRVEVIVFSITAWTTRHNANIHDGSQCRMNRLSPANNTLVQRDWPMPRPKSSEEFLDGIIMPNKSLARHGDQGQAWVK